MKISRRKAIVGMGATAAALASGAAFGKQSRTVSAAGLGERPNIIVFLTDDQAYDTVAGRNALYSSPAVDELAGNGYLLDRSYVTTSICPVSRASIFSGQLAERHRQLGWHWPVNDQSFSTSFPFELRRNGYQTGFVGKWGLSNPIPVDQFDYLDGFDDQGRYFTDAADETHLTNELADSALKAISQFEQSDKPYMLMVSFKAPHGQKDLTLDKSFDRAIKYPEFDMEIHGDYPETVDDIKNLPAFLSQSLTHQGFKSTLTPQPDFQRYVEAYAKLLYGADAATGKILDHASSFGDLDETEVIYLSDNGMMLGDHGIFGKWLMYEQSVKIPFVWKPSIYSQHSGAVNNSFCLNIDVAPTVLKAAGIKIPETYQGIALQDLSAETTRDEYYYSYYVSMDDRLPVCHGLQNKRFKYINYDHHDFRQLFDMVKDPDEVINLAEDPAHAAKVKEMHARMTSMRAQAGAPVDKV